MVTFPVTLTDTWPSFQGHNIFEVEYRKMAHLKDKVTIAQDETISNIWNGAMFGDLDWPLNVSHGLVSISWGSCYFSSSYYYYKNTDYNDTQVTRGLANLPKVTRNIWWSKIRLEDPRGEQICGTFFPSMLWHYWVTGRESANKRLSVGSLVVTVWGVLHVVFL